MKTPLALLRCVALAVLAGVVLSPIMLAAQTPAPDSAKVERLKAQFIKGRELLDAGKPLEALEKFNAILEEEPKAPGSLMMAAMINMNLARFSKAIELLNRFRVLQPEDPRGLLMSIQAHQALKETKKAEALVKDMKRLRATGKVKGVLEAPFFVRERVRRPDGSMVVVNEFFDYRADPRRLFMAEQVSPRGQMMRRMDIAFDPQATKAVRAKDAKLANAEVFYLNEYIFQDGKLANVDVYRQIFSRPDYNKARDWLLDAIIMKPKPMARAEVKNGEIIFPEPALK